MSPAKPDWLRKRLPVGANVQAMEGNLEQNRLHTICQEACCPNQGECFSKGVATFLIMGPTCTRNCRFCDIEPGRPRPLDPTEPARVAAAAADLQLRHVVVTSVTRDDLPDGGAGHFADVVAALRARLPAAAVEILTPDFRGVAGAVDIIIAARPDVFNHNVETVPRLYPAVRPGADYARSLALLAEVGRRSPIAVKSGLMVGLGETREELRTVFHDLAGAGVRLLTIGQYLAPSAAHHPVVRYLPPGEFAELRQEAEAAGIPLVAAAPLVRSSYRADEFCR